MIVGWVVLAHNITFHHRYHLFFYKEILNIIEGGSLWGKMKIKVMFLILCFSFCFANSKDVFASSDQQLICY